MTRFIRLALILGIFTGIALFVAPAANGQSYDVWTDSKSLPVNFPADFEFLDLGNSAFVDLGTNVKHGNRTWRAMQFISDKEITATVPAGKYLFGPLGDGWPKGTVNAFNQLHAGRLTAIVIDGQVIPINPSRIFSFEFDGLNISIYNVFPRFHTPGQHTLQYVWEQKSAFYFVYPFDLLGIPDPVGLGGKRVFVQGEVQGNAPLDGKMIVSYALTVTAAP